MMTAVSKNAYLEAYFYVGVYLCRRAKISKNAFFD